MMRYEKGLLLLSLAALACSGRYEVGEMDPVVAGGGGGGSAGTNTAGQGSPASGGSGNASAGGAAPSNCFTAVAPAPLAAPFVSPTEVASRLSSFIFGDEAWDLGTPALPSETSYAWVAQYVDEAFAIAIEETGGVPGGDYFVRQWLGIDATEVLEGDYGSVLVAQDTSLLAALLQTDLGQGRTGAFSEKAWLASRRHIPARGRAMAEYVFGVFVPTPPDGIDLEVDPTLPDREALELKIVEPSCQSCHRMFTPLGYALGHFDVDGEYRSLDHNRPIDTTGSYPLGSASLEFDGIADFGNKATGTCEANLGVVVRFLHVALTERGYNSESRHALVDQYRQRVQQAFIAERLTYQALVKAFAQSPLVLY